MKGAVDMGSATKCKILAQEMVPLELFFQEWKAISAITLAMPHNTMPDLKEIQTLLPKGKSALHISFQENGKRLKLKTPKKVSLDVPLIEQLEQHKIYVKLLV